MSIINDALKKVQNNLDSHQGLQKRPVTPAPVVPSAGVAVAPPPPSVAPRPAVNPTVTAPTQPAVTKTKTHLKETLLIGLCLLICFGLTGAIIMVVKYYVQAKQPVEINDSVLNDLQINGVLMRGDKKVVLINGEIYEVGELINGFQILNIDFDHVQIVVGSRVKKIKVQNKNTLTLPASVKLQNPDAPKRTPGVIPPDSGNP